MQSMILHGTSIHGYNRTGHKVPLATNSIPGELYGLQMSFYVNLYENLTSINSYSYFGGIRGVLIRIDNGSYMTSKLSEIRLSPGSWSTLSIRRSFKSILPQSFSECLIDNETNAGFNSELFDLIQNSEYRYSQQICFLQCFQLF